MPKITTAPDVQLHVEDWGQGQPIVFLHGWPLSHEMFEYQINQLGNDFRCIMIDRRGFGQSDKPWTGYDYDTLADDLQVVFEQLDLHNITLVGFSMGGAEAIRYITRHGSSRISKLVLLGAAAPRLLKTPAFEEGVEKSVFDTMIETAIEDRAAFMESFSKDFFGATLISSPLSSKLMDWFHALAMKSSPRAFINCVLTFSQADLSDELAGIDVPTLIIHGTGDKIVPFDISAKVLHAGIAGSQLISYEDAPHGFFYTNWPQLNHDLVAFIQEPVPVLE
ncbi:alpha/beta fold hydrolase [Runella sp.]|uniref:alpha/beta fold hydrolase n=1 Tax=Runella sp. TaxID=1960881 RepID=UPI003D0CC8CA